MRDTRVWWDGNEVVFVRWTDRALVFSWRDATETAIQMPRGAVMRLLEKGVLHVEGTIPEWIARTRSVREPVSVLEPAHAMAHAVAAPVAATSSAVTQRVARPVQPRREPVKSAPTNSKLSIVARLIRKLSGGTDGKATARASRN